MSMLNLVSALVVLPAAQTTATITVDATVKKPISPYIYGLNFPDWSKMGRGFTLARQGGNRMSAYNWETNASNAGNDYQHQNDGYMGTSNEPGWTVSNFVRPAQANGATLLLTVPAMGHVSADKNADGDVAKTPDYLNVRFHKSFARKPGKFQYPPDLDDKLVFQDEFVAWVEKTRARNTAAWYSVDNEPDLWGSTHQRVWQKNPTYAQIISINQEYASAIKAVAPRALVFGPANYGWQGFRTFQGAPDGNGRDFLDVYLQEMRRAELKAGKRLLDVVDIHWYPEARGDDVRIAWGEDKPGTPAARIQAPRSLWDASYVETSWIADVLGKKPIVLLPRVQAQISKNYPGTKLGISEYNYGGGKVASGLVAQADVLGLFGRYGVFAACNWGMSATDTAQLGGFRAYINFDGKGAKFGDTALAVTGQRPEQNSVYAAVDKRNSRRLTLVAINKTKEPMSFAIATKGFKGRRARGFAFGAPTFEIARAVSVKVGATISFTAAPESVVSVEVLR